VVTQQQARRSANAERRARESRGLGHAATSVVPARTGQSPNLRSMCADLVMLTALRLFLLTGRDGTTKAHNITIASHHLDTRCAHKLSQTQVSPGIMRSDSDSKDANATNISAPMVKPTILYGDAFPSDADEYLTVDSRDKLVYTSSYWTIRNGEVEHSEYTQLVPTMSRMQRNLLDEQEGDAVHLEHYAFDSGITMYPYHEKVQLHYDYFASSIKTKDGLESIR